MEQFQPYLDRARSVFGSEDGVVATVLAAVAIFLLWRIVAEALRRRRKRHVRAGPSRAQAMENKYRSWPTDHQTSGGTNRQGIADPHRQLEVVAASSYERIPIMNATEYRVFAVVEQVVARLGQGQRVMAQVSLGEVIRPGNSGLSADRKKEAHAAINSKRLDIAVVDRFGRLTIAIEVQGVGHHQAKAFLRDAVKREAVRRSGAVFMEVDGSWTLEEIARRLESLLATSSAGPELARSQSGVQGARTDGSPPSEGPAR